jgi:CDP-glucose 4,6-dehydratase
LEDMVMIDSKFWSGRRVFVTGHTGFKGSWLVHLLASKGAIISGYSLAPQTSPAMFDIANTASKLANHTIGDIRDPEGVKEALKKASPEIAIHMAAQPFVRRSYNDPIETWQTNVMGTVNFLEAARACPSIQAALVITTDKCYENNAWHLGYRETDALGGHDPYSASKAATELVVQSYRKSYFNTGLVLASARAGNVIGGGDWSEDRLIPDAVRAVTRNEPLQIRSPRATRPWQHVLDCLTGYLLLCEHLVKDGRKYASAYNFGPAASANISVQAVLEKLAAAWPQVRWQFDAAAAAAAPHEAAFLYLDSAKASNELGWTPRWDIDASLRITADWYREVIENKSAAAAVTAQQIQDYFAAN